MRQQDRSEMTETAETAQDEPSLFVHHFRDTGVMRQPPPSPSSMPLCPKSPLLSELGVARKCSGETGAYSGNVEVTGEL